MFVPNFEILGQVVAEKSLTEKKVYRQKDKDTNIMTEKAKTIYPLYTSYTGGIINLYVNCVYCTVAVMTIKSFHRLKIGKRGKWHSLLCYCRYLSKCLQICFLHNPLPAI